MTAVLSYIVVWIVGVIVGYLAHIISLNVWLIRHGYNPKDFFEHGKNTNGNFINHSSPTQHG